MLKAARHSLMLKTAAAGAFVCAAWYERLLLAQGDALFVVGGRAVLGHAATLCMMLCLVASCYSLGSLCGLCRGLRGMDRALLGTLAGFALLNCLGNALGQAGFLNPAASGAVFVVLLLLFPARDVRAGFSGGAVPLFLLLAVVYLHFVSGVATSTHDNDFAHYYRAIEAFLANGSLQPTCFAFESYYLKGAGAAFLTMAAGSKYAMPYVSSLGVMAAVALVGRFGSLMTRSRLAFVAAGSLVFVSDFVHSDMYKAHILTSVLILFVLLTLALLSVARTRRLVRKLAVVLTVALCGLLVQSTVSVVIVAIPILALLALKWRQGEGFSCRALAVAGVAGGCFWLLVLGSNQVLYGLADVTPYQLFLRFRNTALTSRWLPDLFFDIYLAFQWSGAGIMRLQAWDWAQFAVKFLVFIAIFRAGVARLSRRAPARAGRLLRAAFPLLAGLVWTALLLRIVEQSSFARFVVYYSAVYFTGIAVVLLTALAAFAPGLLGVARRLPERARWGAVAVFVVLAVALSPKLPRISRQVDHLSFLSGGRSLAEMYGQWREPRDEGLAPLVPKGSRLLPLFQDHYLYVMDALDVVFPDSSDFMDRYPALMAGDAESVASSYRSLRVDHFLVDCGLAQDRPQSLPWFHFLAYSPLFQPQNLAAHFTWTCVGGQRWLLRLRGGNGPELGQDQAFLDQYRACWTFQTNSGDNFYLARMRRLRASHPAFSAIPIPGE